MFFLMCKTGEISKSHIFGEMGGGTFCHTIPGGGGGGGGGFSDSDPDSKTGEISIPVDGWGSLF